MFVQGHIQSKILIRSWDSDPHLLQLDLWIYHRNPKLKILPSQYQGLVGDTELTQLAPGAEIIPEEETVYFHENT